MMKYIGSVLAMIGAGIVLIVAVASLFSPTFKDVWRYEFSSGGEFMIVAAVLAIMIAVLGYVSFSTKPKLLGAVIIAASFAGIIFGSTLTDIAMFFSTLGGFALYSVREEQPKNDKESKEKNPGEKEPGKKEPEKPEQA
ncbi:MAG: hypothetical protein GXY81_04645 [Candidatus Cloacimonetes bacterium]|nr:hypothetical protein [Candidatus Cloacimonadota bacterium]